MMYQQAIDAIIAASPERRLDQGDALAILFHMSALNPSTSRTLIGREDLAPSDLLKGREVCYSASHLTLARGMYERLGKIDSWSFYNGSGREASEYSDGCQVLVFVTWGQNQHASAEYLSDLAKMV